MSSKTKHDNDILSSEEEEEEDNELSNFDLSMISIAGHSEHDCGYCKQKDTSVSFGIWAHSLTCTDYQDLIDRGWRRSGKYLYKPDLERSCCPQYTIRLDATQFNTSKSQKKVIHKFNRYVKGTWDPDPTVKLAEPQATTLKKSSANNYVQIKSLKDYLDEPEVEKENKYKFKTVLEPSSFTNEKFDLYAKYQATIHHDKPEDISQSGFKRFLVDSPMTVEKGTFGSFHQKYMLNGKMIALAVIDILPTCVSSVYFIYDPDYAFLSLGKYSAFREIGLTQAYHERIPDLRYYYMGYYIHTCPKMNYKGLYHPSDLLDPVDYQWRPIEQFKKKFDQEKLSFVTFTNSAKQRDYPPGWLDSKEITKEDLNKVFVYAGEQQIVPVHYLVQFNKSEKFKKNIMNYICAVGLELAHKMVIC